MIGRCDLWELKQGDPEAVDTNLDCTDCGAGGTPTIHVTVCFARMAASREF
jgi:hypothetical protein